MSWIIDSFRPAGRFPRRPAYSRSSRISGTGALFTLGLLEPILAVIHDLAHGGDGIGGDLDQIQIMFLSHAQGLLRRHNAQLLTGFRNQTDFLIPDLFIGLMTCVSDGKAPPDKIKNTAAGKAPVSQQNTPMKTDGVIEC